MNKKYVWSLMLLLAVSAFAARPVADLPVTSTLADFDASNVAYFVQSDGLGPYKNGVDGVKSVLQGGSLNGLSGDWDLDTYNANLKGPDNSLRHAYITFSSANAVQPADPGYTSPANPPFWGTQRLSMRFLAQCSAAPYYISVKAIKPGFPAYCPLLMRFKVSNDYRLVMGHSTPNLAETQDVQISCNAVDASGNCNDWSVDSTPPVSQGGGPGVNQVRARLTLLGKTTNTQEGDFYFTFHIRITNP